MAYKKTKKRFKNQGRKTRGNKFDLSNERKMSFRGGYLSPFQCIPVLPGDDFSIKTEVFCRVMPLIAPVMGRMNLRTYHFFVPERIIWKDSEEFHTRGRNMNSTITVPRCIIDNNTKTQFSKRSLYDLMGCQPIDPADTVLGTHYVSALPFRAYTEVFNEYFRNQEIDPDLDIDKGSGDVNLDLTEIMTLRQKNWDKDYFTTAKLQAMLHPDIYGYANVQAKVESTIYKDQSTVSYSDGTALPTGQHLQADSTGLVLHDSNYSVRLEYLNDLGVDIDDIRRISSMQRYIETMIRTGYRYVDYLKGIWGVKSQDSRHQRPEFLGGHSQPLRISEVLNTSATATEPQGEMAGHGISSGSGRPIRKRFEEHGYIISLMCVTPKAAYNNGMDEHFFKFDHLDYANPFLANLGAQETPSRQLWYDYTESADANNLNFGYKERYSEYKKVVSRSTGEFRDTLAFWTMDRDFAVRPLLNYEFIHCTPKTDVFATSSGDHYLAQIFNNVSVIRNLPYFANPKID